MELHNISSREQIANKRAELLRQLHADEYRIRRDTDGISRRWRRLTDIGSLVSSLALNVSSYVGMFSGVLSIGRRLFSRHRK